MQGLIYHQTVFWGLGMAFFSLPLAAKPESIKPSQMSTASESLEEEQVVEADLPTPDDNGNYQLSSPIHPIWEIVDRGLSGLNCYETFPPNPGSHRVVSRLFSGQVLEVTSRNPAWAESGGKTWLRVQDPWSGQTCWVRAHKDFIKPIEKNSDSFTKSLAF